MEEKNQRKIRLLSEHTINQIAAGEVIENVASVLKELIENSVDAGSSEITIETIGAGRGLIVVKDNGHGMGKEDLPLCIERHATSKIIDADDLFKLSTLGFRGEALASIASVSKMKIHSSTRDGIGFQMCVEGGKIISFQELPRKKGTTIEVSSLFYNTPARKKFQKSISSESAEILKSFILSALCYENISFEWISEGKKEFTLRKEERRLERLLGKEFAENGVGINISHGFYHLEGHFVKPHIHRPNRGTQYLFVNLRPVSSPLLASFIENAYGTRLPVHRFPLFMLHLQVPPEEIDVNIHPRKKEVRFHEEKKIEELIQRGIKIALEEKKESLPKITFPTSQAFSLGRQELVQRVEEKVIPRTNFMILTLLGDYLLAKESEEEILVVDTKRARRRIFFEKLGTKNEALPIQKLLFPLTIERPFLEKKHLDLLNNLGIAIRHFGGYSYLIEAYPDVFNEEEVLTLVDNVIEEKASDHKLLFCKQIKKRIATHEEGIRLLEELFRCDEPHLCPELKPTFKRLNPKEVGKWL